MLKLKKNFKVLKGKKILKHHQTVAPERVPQVGWQLFGVRLPNFELQILFLKQHQVVQISCFHEFLLSFKEHYLSPNILIAPTLDEAKSTIS